MGHPILTSMNIKSYLHDLVRSLPLNPTNMQFPDCELNTDKIRVIMINEVPPQNPDDWFYSTAESPDYMKTTLALFENAGVDVKSISDILGLGIYITTAVKTPKTGYTVDPEAVKAQLLLLEAEIKLFPNLKVIMLMGDVAKKAFNMIAKKTTKKNIIPSESTYKIRNNEFYWGDIRVFPSYIMTGGNILIEKSKCEMVSDDIRRMMHLI